MKKQRMVFAKLCMICGLVFLAAAPLYGGGKSMEPLYNLNESATLEPQRYKVRQEIYNLFSLPKDGVVGTNNMNNAITVIGFNKDRIKFDQYFKDVLMEVGGSGIFLPPISQDTIGFAQGRGFDSFDFRTKEHKQYLISRSFEDTIERLAIADARKRQFIFEMVRFPKKSKGTGDDFIKLIQLVDLTGKEPRVIKEIKKEPKVWWFVAVDKFFMFRHDKMQVYTTSLEPAYHPLQDVFERNKGKFKAWRVHVHPTLPFAIIVDRNSKTYIMSWGKGRNEEPVAVSNGETQDFTFSPDGKWVVFKDDRPDPAHTYLAPVSEKYPNFIGSPIFLSKKSFRENEGAWTTNPTSFVGTNYDELYRWELTTTAHPESNKPDYHEFIVERDLEKLKKEKKQGLGEK